MTKQVFIQFHTIAAQQKLSAAAILLWHHIYFAGEAQGRHTELHLRTADVQNALAITRNGLQKVRRTLVNNGLLQVRIDARQQVYYTLTIDGMPLEDMPTHSAPADKHKARTQTNTQTNTKALTRTAAKPYRPDTQYPGDIIHNNAYHKLVDAFCRRYGTNHQLQLNLVQFLHQRKQKGKTLTKAGLDALLDKLVQLAEENVHTMVHILEQSIQRGWLGLYAYTGTAGYSSSRSIRRPAAAAYSRPSRIPAYDTAYVDLSFLER